MANVWKSAEVGVKIKKGRYTFEGCVRYTSSEKYNCLYDNYLVCVNSGKAHLI